MLKIAGRPFRKCVRGKRISFGTQYDAGVDGHQFRGQELVCPILNGSKFQYSVGAQHFAQSDGVPAARTQRLFAVNLGDLVSLEQLKSLVLNMPQCEYRQYLDNVVAEAGRMPSSGKSESLG